MIDSVPVMLRLVRRKDWKKRALAAVASPFMVAAFAAVMAIFMVIMVFAAPLYFAFAEDPWQRKSDVEGI